MRPAALLVALVSVLIGIAGLVSPDSLMNVRRMYVDSTIGLHVAGAVRLAMGVALILFAPASRAPNTLRVIGGAMCLQGIVPQFYTVDRARELLEWEAMLGATVLRIGAAIALGTGAFIAVVSRPRSISAARP